MGGNGCGGGCFLNRVNAMNIKLLDEISFEDPHVKKLNYEQCLFLKNIMTSPTPGAQVDSRLNLWICPAGFTL